MRAKKQEKNNHDETIEVMLQRVQERSSRDSSKQKNSKPSTNVDEAYDQHKMQIQQLRDEIAYLKNHH
jgi:cytidylate kinase